MLGRQSGLIVLVCALGLCVHIAACLYGCPSRIVLKLQLELTTVNGHM